MQQIGDYSMNETKTNVMRILDKLKIEYKTYFYESDDGKIDGLSVANKLSKSPETVFKTLVTKGAKNYYVFVVPVLKELNLKACAKAVDEKSVEMIKTTDLMKVTGYIRGGCSPIGMKKPFITVIDKSLEELPFVTLSGGKIGCQIELSPSDLKVAVPYKTECITAD